MTDPNAYYYPITGRKDTGGVFDRLPIEDLQKNHPRQFTLFILAVAATQGVKDSPIEVTLPAESWMEIAGVHGRPYTEYAGDRKAAEHKKSDFSHDDPKDSLPNPPRYGGMHSTSRKISLLKCECIRLLQVCRLHLAV